jgi:primosomal protein N' (replication factor Y)
MPSSEKIILSIAVPIPVDRLFDYLLPITHNTHNLQAGVRIKVPFGKSFKIGILIEVKNSSDSPADKLKHAEEILDASPLLLANDLKLLHWAHRYYHHPIGDIFISALPTALRKGKSSLLKAVTYYELSTLGKGFDLSLFKNAHKQRALFEFISKQEQGRSQATIASHFNLWQTSLKALLKKELIQSCEPVQDALSVHQEPLIANTEQKIAIKHIIQNDSHFSVSLLDGVTGSGKTEVYLQSIQATLEKGLQVLVLLPEITLTPQLEARFNARFTTKIETFHSKHTETQRLNAWLNMQKNKSLILLGTRSALLTPCPNLGLIILDEEHDSSFKQQEGFRFSARDVAIVRAKILNIPIILGSATPSLESLYNVKQNRYKHLVLLQRAGVATAPSFTLLDIRNQYLQEGLSPRLIKIIQNTLAKKEQVLLFLNRRGFSPTLMCHSCGWIAQCTRCDANLVVHYQQKKLRCHHCSSEQFLIKICPDCQSEELKPLGLGTERVEYALNNLFPQKKIIRLDRDSTQKKGTLEKQLELINSGQVDIILGTQMLAKGHHFPNVTLVALLDVDSGLFSIDFHATEKLAQLIIQVAGRAGREKKKGQVIMQTRQPEHPLLNTLIHHGYATFAQSALAERKEAQLPPYSFQALLRATAIDSQLALDFLSELSLIINKQPFNTLLLGPVPAPMPKKAGQFRYQLLLQNKQRKSLHLLLNYLIPKISQLKLARKVKWSLDVDPVDLY